jgi:hypothetical protein
METYVCNRKETRFEEFLCFILKYDIAQITRSAEAIDMEFNTSFVTLYIKALRAASDSIA